MSEEADKVIVVAGALTAPLWVSPAEVASRLPRLSAIADLQVAAADASPPMLEALPRELAHDRWLRAQPTLRSAAIAPGALSAVRRVARYNRDLSGWLLEPAHFHLAQDHVVLVAGATHDLTGSDARELADAVAPLLAEESFALDVLAPAAWLLTPEGRPLQVECASSEAAAGRNVEGYLPRGDHARRYRKLLNEVQMTWHEHPVNQRREESGKLPINSLWLSGPVVPAALAAWSETAREGHCELDDTLLDARLRDDRQAWLDALQAVDARLAGCLSAAVPGDILLCGDQDCRWLQRRGKLARAPQQAPAARRMATLLRSLGALIREGGEASGRAGNATGGIALAAMFIEGPLDA